jgi:hypothetical protein
MKMQPMRRETDFAGDWKKDTVHGAAVESCPPQSKKVRENSRAECGTESLTSGKHTKFATSLAGDIGIRVANKLSR